MCYSFNSCGWHWHKWNPRLGGVVQSTWEAQNSGETLKLALGFLGTVAITLLLQRSSLNENPFACHLQLILADPGPTVIQKLHAAKFTELIGDDKISLTVGDAVKKFAPKAVDSVWWRWAKSSMGGPQTSFNYFWIMLHVCKVRIYAAEQHDCTQNSL